MRTLMAVVLTLCLLVSKAIAQEASSESPPKTFQLQWQEDCTYVSVSMNDINKNISFTREPQYKGTDILRGALPTGRAEMGFALDRASGTLYLDTNQNLDLTDDAAVTSDSSFSGSYNFEKMQIVSPESQITYRVSLHIMNVGRVNQTHISGNVSSGWSGEIELNGRTWWAIVGDNMDGVLDEYDVLMLETSEPDESSRTRFESDFAFGEPIFVDGTAYTFAFDPPTATLTVAEDKSAFTMGELKVEGKSISKAVLNSLSPDAPDVLITGETGTIQVPTGDYKVASVALGEGENAYTYSSRFKMPSFFDMVAMRGLDEEKPDLSVYANTPATLKYGGPLQNTVTAKRTGTKLKLTYALLGIGGEEYEMGVFGSDSPATYSIYKGTQKIVQDRFQPGFLMGFGEDASAIVSLPLLTHGELKITASTDLGDLGPAEGPPAIVHWNILWNLFPHAPWLGLVVLLCLKPNRKPAAWTILIPLAISGALSAAFSSANQPTVPNFASPFGSMSGLSTNATTVTWMCIAISALCLLSFSLTSSEGAARFFMAILIMLCAGAISALFSVAFEINISSIGPLMKNFLVFLFDSLAFLLALLLTRASCKKNYSRRKFHVIFLVLFVAAEILVSLPLMLPSMLFGFNPSMMAFGLLSNVITSIGIYLLILPFLLLVTFNRFYHDRFLKTFGFSQPWELPNFSQQPPPLPIE